MLNDTEQESTAGFVTPTLRGNLDQTLGGNSSTTTFPKPAGRLSGPSNRNTTSAIQTV